MIDTIRRVPGSIKHMGQVTAIVVLSLAAATAQPATAQDLVLVMDPPSVESNRYWVSGTDFTFPAMQSLVGNDPETGVYDNSGLAESWEHNDDYTVWTFRLHPDAEFHNGWGPVTAADVVHSYELHTGVDANLTGVNLMLADRVEAVDEHTVRFHLPEPRPTYLFAHAGRGTLLIYSKAQYEAEGLDGYDANPAGTSQLQFVSREVGKGVTFARVNDHWSGQDAAFDTLEIRYVAEQATKLALLLSNEADLVMLPRELHPATTAGGYEIISSQIPSMQTAFLFNGQYYQPDDEALDPTLPWLDVRIREAMNRAIDREAMIDVLYDGRADRLTQFLMAPGHEGYAPELNDRFDEMYGYDPERARALLAEAGYPDAFENPVIPIISTALSGNPEFGTMAELVQVFLDEAGFQTQIVEMDWGSVGSLRNAREARFLMPMRNAPVRPSDAGILSFFTAQYRPRNVFEHPLTEELASRYAASYDQEERNELARALFVYHFENYTTMPIATVTTDVVVNPETVEGWVFPGVTSAGIGHFHLIQPAD